jgi:IclR family transcriptional regulator, KDG regulon repressor
MLARPSKISPSIFRFCCVDRAAPDYENIRMKDDVFYSNTNGVRPLSSVLKTLRLLDELGASQTPMRLAEIAKASGMSRATAYQKLVTLVHAGWIEQTTGGAYRLSLQATRMGLAALTQASLGERIVPFLQRLAAESGETASLAVIDGRHARLVQRVESGGILRAELHIGSLLDLDQSASGRVLVAFADPSVIARLRKMDVPLPNERLLAQVRREQFAPSSGKSFEGVKGVAAPIFDAGGLCIAAVSLVGPLPRFTIDKTRPPLMRAAAAISDFIRGQRQ